jgi:A/G-specific adenine glycosylase
VSIVVMMLMGKTVGRRSERQEASDYPDAAPPCRPAAGADAPASSPAGRPSSEAAFAPALLAWHRVHGRHDLPWQRTRDPYRIWLSEIMLQQTQVTTVIPYYVRFLERLPDVAALAAAPADQVMALWAGLGYYARARNLHACAKAVVERHRGRFPGTADALAELPGVGRSTAAAIAAFAFGRRGAILDGNVKRVLCRVFAVDGFPGQSTVERALWALADRLLPAADIEAYTQGLMDLGATLCLPRRPACDRCPMHGTCRARIEARVEELPVARPKRALPEREVGVLILRRGDAVLLERRPPAGIWGGLWSLPELHDGEPPDEAVLRLLGQRTACAAGESIRHVFTHFRLEIRPWEGVVGEPASRVAEPGNHAWVRSGELERHGLPTPIRTLLKRSGS